MIIFKKVQDLVDFLENQRQIGRGIGFVPTMGALHKGHISLISRSINEGLLSVCSIFLNPTQFNDNDDYLKYPVTTSEDIELLADAGCDVLFLPGVDEVYPDGADAVAAYDFGYLETVLEGAHRPGHFRGVGQVVGRLLDIVEPDRIFMGRKDYQQCLVVQSLLALTGRAESVLEMCDTVREQDGLAMSSRNRRLTEPQRAVAGLIYQCLISIQAKKDAGNFAIVRKECEDLLRAKGFEPEYVSLAKAGDLTVLDEYDSGIDMTALIAARIGSIRLIDNIAV